MVRPVPGLTLDQQPLNVLRRMLMWGEARGETSSGKLAVLWVVQNRTTIGNSAKAVMLKPRAFSCFNPGPALDRLMKANELEPNTWAICDAIADLWESGATLDITRGANHYYNFKVVSPKWGRGSPDWKETAVIGNHVFGICP